MNRTNPNLLPFFARLDGGKTSGFFTNNIKKNVNSETANIKANGFSGRGNGNSYVGVVKGVAKPANVDDKTLPAVELDDDCLQSRDLSNSLLCRVKEFASLANLQRTLSNEGLWTLKFNTWASFGSCWNLPPRKVEDDSVDRGRGIPFKLWTNNTFSRIANKWGELLDVDDQEESCFHSKRLCIHTQMVRSISEEFKIMHRGKTYWIRANETPGWVLDFSDEFEEDDIDDNNVSVEGDSEQNPDILGDDNDEEKISVTIFKVDEQHEIPPGFSPKEEYDENSLQEGGDNKDMEYLKDRKEESKKSKFTHKSNDGGNDSTSTGHFKVSKLPRTGSSILGLLDEVVRVGTVMGYKMEGVMNNITEIIEAQGADEAYSIKDDNAIRYLMGKFKQLK
nr:nucleotide-binding alpha-beta plait domain-containing protein [Tanacetum cinerariifolium]